jgi:hypothetical protein
LSPRSRRSTAPLSGVGPVITAAAVPPIARVASIEGKEALALYLLRIARNTEALGEQLALLRTALAERASLLAASDGRAPPE